MIKKKMAQNHKDRGQERRQFNIGSWKADGRNGNDLAELNQSWLWGSKPASSFASEIPKS